MEWMPIAANVPMAVAANAEMTATVNVTVSASMTMESWKSASYQRKENPVQCPIVLLSLNE